MTYEEYKTTEQEVQKRLHKYYSSYKPMSYYNCEVREARLQAKKFGYEELFNDVLLKSRTLKYRTFQRNKCIGNRYFADFVDLENKIIIEIDEDYHKTLKVKLYDSRRDTFLRMFGYKVIRLPVSKRDAWLAYIDKIINP
jgi:very-short-patch-repair endonuclease